MGLTGGIGCGKTAVTDLLAARGATIIDADLVAREVVLPGTPTYQALVGRFGEGILAPDGAIDRPSLAAATFGDPAALADLNAITHPAIGLEMLRRLEEASHSDAVVVLAIPLLRAEHRSTMHLDAVAIVDCPFDEALRRLVELRGMDPRDARERIAAQPTRQERLADADVVVDNSGSPEDLVAQVDRLWRWIADHRAAPASP